LFGRILLLSPFALIGCGDPLVVAEQSGELGSGDAGLEVVTICGNALCKNRETKITDTKVVGIGCCVDPRLSLCGIVEFANTCLPVDQPGTLDTSCQTLPNTPLGTLSGCCRPDGTCGVLETGLGLGCTQVPLLSQLSSCTYKKE
jgi:hypothetical protein